MRTVQELLLTLLLDTSIGKRPIDFLLLRKKKFFSLSCTMKVWGGVSNTFPLRNPDMFFCPKESGHSSLKG